MHTYVYAHKHAYITKGVHFYIFAQECVCCIKSFTVKQRKYSINSSKIFSAIQDQHHANLIFKIWPNIKMNKTDMHSCTWDGRCATATELLLLVVPGTVVSAIYAALSTPTRFWKAVYMNLPNAFRIRGSSLLRRNLNALLDSISQMFS